MTQDGPRSDTLMLQLDDGTWMARVSLPGQVIEVAGRDRMPRARLDGTWRTRRGRAVRLAAWLCVGGWSLLIVALAWVASGLSHRD